MGYVLNGEHLDQVLNGLKSEYVIYAPVFFEGGGRLSDTDCVRYAEIQSVDEIVFDVKSQFSFKEILTPISQTLFYFTEDEVKEADPQKKGAVIFLRSCDLHAVKRLDDMYLNNGNPDYYYERVRERVHFVLMGCDKSFDSCFCVDMGTNVSANYDLSVDRKDGTYYVDCKWDELAEALAANSERTEDVTPAHVTETITHVNIPENLTNEIAKSSMWEEYNKRCLACGRCNTVCPTCTCFTMQDLYYDDNGKVGERRRVFASCMVDGYTDVAGGGSYRKKYGERMRFKVLHKVLNYKARKGYHMCVGCGRCDDICPEYISFSHIINRLEEGMKEVEGNE